MDDVIDVIKDEATEDIYRLAGVVRRRARVHAGRGVAAQAPAVARRQPGDGVPGRGGRRRCSTGTIDALPSLAVFMPIVAGMGGNAATQTLTVIVRGIALGELTWGNSRKALLKEAVVGIGNGLALGLVAAAGGVGDARRSGARAAARHGDGHQHVRGGHRRDCWFRSGCKRLKIDPALASSVFITTLDRRVSGSASFLGLATVFAAGYLTRAV